MQLSIKAAGENVKIKRFVERDSMERVHECVLAVLAMESDPVDPRL